MASWGAHTRITMPWVAMRSRDSSSRLSGMAQALAESGELDLFIVGTGKDLMPLAAPLRAKLRNAGIGCEVMSTGAAVRTYNMLVDEGRRVAALLIAV